MIRLALSIATGAAALFSVPAWAQQAAYPVKPIHVVVPATAGGTSDFLIRLMSPKLAEELGQNIIVENKAGAGTNIGNDYVAKAAPNGYVLLINGLPLATNSALFKSLPYDPAKDYAPIIHVANMTNVIAVTPDSPIKSLNDLIEAAKKNPGKLNYGSPANGSSGHVAGVLLQEATGIDVTHLAYRGNAQATTDLIGGSLQFGVVNMPVALPFVKGNKLRALAVTSAKRSSLMPDVPTVSELIGKPYDSSGWFGVLAPAGTPPEVVQKLHTAFTKVLAMPDIQKSIEGGGAEVVGGSSAEFGSLIRKEEQVLGAALRKVGVQPQ